MNRIVRHNLPWILLLPLLIITGCQVGTRTDVTSIPSVISPSTLAPKSPTPLATSTIAVAPTQSPTKTPSPGEVEYHCIDISDDPATLSGINGKMVLNGEIERPNVDGKFLHNPSLLVDLQSGEQIPLAPDGGPIFSFDVSPSGRYLAYDTKYGNDYTFMRINIVDSMNTPVRKFVEETASFHWLNDEILFITGQIGGNNPLVALYPFEGARKIIQPFVTEEERVAPFDIEVIRAWGFYALHKIIYNPKFTHAIYAASDGVIFHDLVNGQDKASIKSLSYDGGWGISPKWSPDGSKLAIGLNTKLNSNKYEIVILDREGNRILATRLSILPGPVHISSLSWSPNGNRLAFWYTNNDLLDSDPQLINKNMRLALFDTATQKITDYCIVKDFDNFQEHRSDTSPIWSPDGNFLLFAKSSSKDDDPSVIVVDLENERAAIVMNGYEPVGWMK